MHTNTTPSTIHSLTAILSKLGFLYAGFLALIAFFAYGEPTATGFQALAELNNDLRGAFWWALGSFILWKVSDRTRPTVYRKGGV